MFGTSELWWTCLNGATFDVHRTRSQEYIPSIQRKIGKDQISIDHWRSIVRNYTRRFLTYPNDKLSAIAGVANHYSQEFNSRYVCGLWESLLFSELMWCSTRSDISRPLTHRAPTWSWASVDGEIHHDWCAKSGRSILPNLIECRVTPASPSSPFGPVIPEMCSLRISTSLISVIWQGDRKYISVETHKRKWPGNDEYDQEKILQKVGLTQADALEESLPTEVWVLPITIWPVRGLLLEHVQHDTYRRVGLVLRLWDEKLMDSPKFRQAITLV